MTRLQRKMEEERKVVQSLAGELVERLGADALLVVWTGRFSRKTYVNAGSFGNALAVDGLKEWVYEQVMKEAEQKQNAKDDDEEDEDEDEDED